MEKEERKYLTEEEKNTVGRECCSCGSTVNIHYHHIVPTSLGGSNRISNFACVCIECHGLIHHQKKHFFKNQVKGIEEAKKGGKYTGRKPKQIDEVKFLAMCEEWQNKKRTATSIMKEFNIKGNTFYRWINQYNEKNPEKKMVVKKQSPKLKSANKRPHIEIDVNKFKLMANEWRNHNLSPKLIMKEFGITKYIFFRLLKKYGIKKITYRDVDIEKLKAMCLEWANKKRTYISIVKELNITWAILEKLKRIHGIRKIPIKEII